MTVLFSLKVASETLGDGAANFYIVKSLAKRITYAQILLRLDLVAFPIHFVSDPVARMLLTTSRMLRSSKKLMNIIRTVGIPAKERKIQIRKYAIFWLYRVVYKWFIYTFFNIKLNTI